MQNQLISSEVQFQFTHPGRGATLMCPLLLQRGQFQFTHPGRGATCCRCFGSCFCSCFNSRTPGGVRLFAIYLFIIYLSFQFTHPGRGATESGWTHRLVLPCFNSRTPGGVRLPRGTVAPRSRAGFNSRTPGGVRHGKVVYDYTIDEFQFTHPGRGATVWCKVAYYGADKQA